jgi:hypothetical protein
MFSLCLRFVYLGGDSKPIDLWEWFLGGLYLSNSRECYCFLGLKRFLAGGPGLIIFISLFLNSNFLFATNVLSLCVM